MELLDLGNDNLVRLKAITEALEFSTVVRSQGAQQIIELNVENGTSYMVGLYKTPLIAVARNFATAGTHFPLHRHDEWELLLVYYGRMVLNVEGKEIKLAEKDFYYNKPGVEHSAEFPKDCWFLSITMPASGNWPEGG